MTTKIDPEMEAILEKRKADYIQRTLSRWSDEDIETIRNACSHMPMCEVVKLFPGKPIYQIRDIMRILGIEKFDSTHMRNKNRWTDEEIRILAKHCTYMRPEELLVLLPGRTVPAIKKKIQKLFPKNKG